MTPKVPAYETRHGLAVWCIQCGEWHRHGRGDGHRLAHCRSATSPYLWTGYDLVVVGPMTRHVKRRLEATS